MYAHSGAGSISLSFLFSLPSVSVLCGVFYVKYVSSRSVWHNISVLHINVTQARPEGRVRRASYLLSRKVIDLKKANTY